MAQKRSGNNAPRRGSGAAAKRKGGKTRNDFITALIIIAIFAFACYLLWTYVFAPKDDGPNSYKGTASLDLDVHFVDVGQGDACVVELPDDRTMLIDSGSSDSKDTLIHYIEDNIKRDNKTITYFDIVIITHSDEDHCGEMRDVLRKFPGKTVYRPNQEASYASGDGDPGKEDLLGDYSAKNTKTYYEAISAAYAPAADFTPTVIVTDATDEKQNLIVADGKNPGEEGYYTVTFYTPTKTKYSNKNDYSPIFVLEYMGRKIALSGDAEAANEKEFVGLVQKGEGKFSVFGSSYSVDVIKLGHHGSQTSNSEDYLNIMTKSAKRADIIVIISCGTGNSYGHPHTAVLERIARLGFNDENVLRTDLRGTIIVSIAKDDDGYYKVKSVTEKAADETSGAATAALAA